MKNNKPHFFQNIGLRILSLVLAVILWVVVNNVNDPIGQMTISNLTVRLLHTNEITDDGKVYTVLDSTDTVPVVTVRASRSIIDSLDSSNIVATADVEDMTDDGQIKIHYYSTKYDSEITSITGSIQYVHLSVEDKSTSSFVLKTSTSGDVADGYQVASITPEQNQIRVSGRNRQHLHLLRHPAPGRGRQSGGHVEPDDEHHERQDLRDREPDLLRADHCPVHGEPCRRIHALGSPHD